MSTERRFTAQAIQRCGFVGLRGEAARFRVWAPRAQRASVVLIRGEERQTIDLEPAEEGYFVRELEQVADGQQYAVRLDGGPERPDPCSRFQPHDVHGPSAVYRPERFAWSDQAWRGIQQEDLVIYELHVGTFTPEGTFDAVIPRLRSLKELGVTALEIMPVAQFPGARNWGYDGVLLFAPQNSYGGPAGLQRLVNACHQEGLAVVLDVVYNHFGPEGNYLSEFGPYFTEAYRTPWGSAVNYDGRGCDAVRQYVLDNVRMWLEEFHFDALRLDAVHAIYDFSPKHILQAIQELADEVAEGTGRPRYIIAESDLNDPRLLLPPQRGGYGLSAQWSDDFHHAVHSLLTGETQGYYEDFGSREHLQEVLNEPFYYNGRYSRHRGRSHGAPAADLPGERFVISIQNHDQVGNRASGDRFGALLGPEAQRLAASLLLLAPHIPMIFMGDEYGETNPFQFFCSFCDQELVEAVRKGRKSEFAAFKWQGEVPDPHSPDTFAASQLTWSWPAGTLQEGIRRLYSDLLSARREWPALRDFQQRTARLVGDGSDPAVLELVRGGTVASAGQTLIVFCNLSDQNQKLPRLEHAARDVGPLFSSAGRRYRGVRADWVQAEELLPYECLALGPTSWRSFGLAEG